MSCFQAIISAIEADGFKPEIRGEGVDLCGQIDVHGHRIPLHICFDDLSLAEAPKLYVPDLSMIERVVMPHVDDDGELCALDRSRFVFDRSQAPGQVRGMIIKAKDVLTEGLMASATRQIADEFDSYWSQSISSAPLGLEPQNPPSSRAVSRNVLTTSATLSFDPHHSKPNTVRELIDWLNYWDPSLGEKVVRAIAQASADDPEVFVYTPNAAIGARVLVSARGTTFQKTFKRPGSWQKFAKSSAIGELKIERFKARSFDLRTLFATNGGGESAPLAACNVVLVGCGAVGGYLARILGQMGAGIDEFLTLIDPDVLSFSNTRRHALGLNSFGKNKATACRQAILSDFPALRIRDVVGNATSKEAILEEADLVIDATGEEGFSEWLNEWAIERRRKDAETPAIQFVWIEGWGAAVQTFFFEDEQFACYHCLGDRFTALREAPPEPVVACGEQNTTPYGPSAPSAAASLAASQLTGWANGNAQPLIRTLRLDWKGTIKRDPTNPKKAKSCTACGGEAR